MKHSFSIFNSPDGVLIARLQAGLRLNQLQNITASYQFTFCTGCSASRAHCRVFPWPVARYFALELRGVPLIVDKLSEQPNCDLAITQPELINSVVSGDLP